MIPTEILYIPTLIFSVILVIVSIFALIFVFFASVRVTQFLFSVLELVLENQRPNVIRFLNRHLHTTIPLNSRLSDSD